MGPDLTDMTDKVIILKKTIKTRGSWGNKVYYLIKTFTPSVAAHFFINR